MSDLLAARLQMALSLGFHIIFACISMVMPFLMATTHYLWLRQGKQVHLDLTKAWSKAVAILFATGAVSGTLLSFELGLLWPRFMEHAGPIFGLPFSLEGTAFFLEAIALGLFLYGWNRMNPWIHWLSGVAVGVTGLFSGILVIAANSWMNSPSGFDYKDGQFLNIDPIAAMFNDAWFYQALHMTVAAFVATGFAAAGLHALYYLLKRRSIFHRTALTISLWFAGVNALILPLTGDLLGKDVVQRQPLKFAAMEAHFQTERRASLIIGGIPDTDQRQVPYSLKIPGLLSFLAYNDLDAEVLGLDAFPEEEWPPVVPVHLAFQVMVGIGSVLALVSVVFIASHLLRQRLSHSLIERRWFLLLLASLTPLGFVAVEAGWIVTEVGRQPWIIYKVLRTADSLTPMPGLVYSLVLYTILYLALSLIVIWLLKRQMQVVENEYPSAQELWKQ